MAHYPKPFFRPVRGLWYVQIDGKQINLGADKTEAFKAYHGLMQHRRRCRQRAVCGGGSEWHHVVEPAIQE